MSILEESIKKVKVLKNYIDGKWKVPDNSGYLDVENPATGEILAQVPLASCLRKEFSWLSRVYWKENIVWSPGYFVSTIGLDEKSILEYVKLQKTPRI